MPDFTQKTVKILSSYKFFYTFSLKRNLIFDIIKIDLVEDLFQLASPRNGANMAKKEKADDIHAKCRKHYF